MRGAAILKLKVGARPNLQLSEWEFDLQAGRSVFPTHKLEFPLSDYKWSTP